MKCKTTYFHFSWIATLTLILSSIIIVGNDDIVNIEEIIDEESEDQSAIQSVDADNFSTDIDIDLVDYVQETSPIISGSPEDYHESVPPAFIHQPENARLFMPEDRSITRASDDENEKGSVLLRPIDTVEGNMTIDYVNETFDNYDFYKLDADDVNPSPFAPNGTIIANLTLNSYTSEDTLYEGRIDGNQSMIEDYIDFLWITIYYLDYFGEGFYLTGQEFWYDNGDDNDGWSFEENWSCRFEIPIPSYTEEDTDGYANGNSERGWYYIYLRQSYYYNIQYFTNFLNRNQVRWPFGTFI